MDTTEGAGRPSLLYVNAAAGAVLFLVVLVILTGGFTFTAGPLQVGVTTVRVPAFVLAALLLARHILLAPAGGERTWRDRFFGAPGSSQERWRAVETLGLMTLLFALLVSMEVTGRYDSLEIDGFGLAAAVQALWNTMEGRLLATTLGGGGNYLALHFSPGLVLLAPVISLWQTPLALEWLAIFTLALGAWPVYMMVLRDTGERRWAVALAALYLSHPLLRGGGLHGFDPASLSVTPLLIAFYLLHERRRLSGYVFLVAALMMYEGAWLAAAFLGLYISLGRRRWREGLFLFLPTFYGYIFILSFVMPRLGSPVLPTLGAWSHLGHSLGEVIKNIFLHPGQTLTLLGGPGRVDYLLLVLGPLAFLPLFGPARFLPVLPLLLADLLAGDPLYRSALSPNGLMIIPFVLAASSSGLARVLGLLHGRPATGSVRLALAGALLLGTLLAFDPVPFSGRRADSLGNFAAEFKEAVDAVPGGASLAASGTLLPYLCRRETVRQISAAADVEYVVVDLMTLRRRAGEGAAGDSLVSRLRKADLSPVAGGSSVINLGPAAEGKGIGDLERLLDKSSLP